LGSGNSQEVVVKGNHVKITLMSIVIVEEIGKKLSQRMEQQNHKDTLGLVEINRNIGFLGHGAELAFRKSELRI